MLVAQDGGKMALLTEQVKKLALSIIRWMQVNY